MVREREIISSHILPSILTVIVPVAFIAVAIVAIVVTVAILAPIVSAGMVVAIPVVGFWAPLQLQLAVYLGSNSSPLVIRTPALVVLGLQLAAKNHKSSLPILVDRFPEIPSGVLLMHTHNQLRSWDAIWVTGTSRLRHSRGPSLLVVVLLLESCGINHSGHLTQHMGPICRLL